MDAWRTECADVKVEAIHEQVPKQGTIGDSLLHEMVPRTDGNRTLRGPAPLPKIEQRGFKPLNIRNTRRPIRILEAHQRRHRTSVPLQHGQQRPDGVVDDAFPFEIRRRPPVQAGLTKHGNDHRRK